MSCRGQFAEKDVGVGDGVGVGVDVYVVPDFEPHAARANSTAIMAKVNNTVLACSTILLIIYLLLLIYVTRHKINLAQWSYRSHKIGGQIIKNL
jgi:hypothetical protein